MSEIWHEGTPVRVSLSDEHIATHVMTNDNTLLGRCLVAYEEAFEEAITSQAVNPMSRRRGLAAVLEHLAVELVVMNQRDPRLTVHELARRLTLEAAGELAGWAEPDEEPEDDWFSHPSLTAEERNPTLR
jgi:hypothetical protein